MNTLTVRQFIETLDFDAATPEQLERALADLNAIREMEKATRATFKARLFHRIDSTKQPMLIGGQRWYIGLPLEHYVDDAPALLDAMFSAAGGDFGPMADCLTADWFKISQVRQLLGEDRCRELVRSERTPKLVDGKPTKQLLSADPNFGGR